MTIREYLWDRRAGYGTLAAALSLSLLFLAAFRTAAAAMWLLSGIFLISVTLHSIWDYTRKKAYYNRVLTSLEDLDQKFLLPEMLPEPLFYEGTLLGQVLSECCKSMTEHVAEHRRQNREFREYIELWVHEVKIPVASLQLMVHNLADPSEKMSVQLRRIDDDIEQVLYYARAENAEKDYLIQETPLQKIFGSTAVKNREALQMAGAQLETAGLEARVLTDAKWMEFILGQLLDNSLKYRSPDRPLQIRVWAEEQKDGVSLHYRDNGIGIPAEDLPYIFEKTFTGSNGRLASRSTGMGLYLVKNLCRRLGHRIEAVSAPGEYAEFTIVFSRNTLFGE